MPKNRIFTEESRDEIVNSLTNHSKSKQSWSFSKEKRFKRVNSNCPHVAYQKETSTISQRKHLFPTARRKVFTEESVAPSSWKYRPSNPDKNQTISFAQGRDVRDSLTEGNSNQLLHQQRNRQSKSWLIKNPGPGDYSYQDKHRKGFTMRPQTAKDRNCTQWVIIDFVENKEQSEVPGPGTYEEDEVKLTGKNIVSKFKSSVSGIMTKYKRFHIPQRTCTIIAAKVPPAWAYNVSSARKIKGGKIGREYRSTFLDRISMETKTPGPGNYKLPSEFGHYKKIELFFWFH